ncbi:MAG: hypothetical protein JSR33_12800 [Proteobacteria bacterium]|nr:hypothetical protein [Pseudomonadota bacterium]
MTREPNLSSNTENFLAMLQELYEWRDGQKEEIVPTSCKKIQDGLVAFLSLKKPVTTYVESRLHGLQYFVKQFLHYETLPDFKSIKAGVQWLLFCAEEDSELKKSPELIAHFDAHVMQGEIIKIRPDEEKFKKTTGLRFPKIDDHAKQLVAYCANFKEWQLNFVTLAQMKSSDHASSLESELEQKRKNIKKKLDNPFTPASPAKGSPAKEQDSDFKKPPRLPLDFMRKRQMHFSSYQLPLPPLPPPPPVPPSISSLMKEFECVVTHKIFQNPATLHCKNMHTVEKDIAKKVLKENRCCPVCNEKIVLYKNYQVKYISYPLLQTILNQLLFLFPEYKHNQYNNSKSMANTPTEHKGNPEQQIKELMNNFRCPITKKYFLNPIMLNCGGIHPIEKSARTQLPDFDKKKACCPTCENPVSRYWANQSLKNILDKLILIFPSYQKDRYVENNLPLSRCENRVKLFAPPASIAPAPLRTAKIPVTLRPGLNRSGS